MKDFLSHSMCEMRNGNLLKSRVSEIHVKRIRVNQGVGVFVKVHDSLSSFYEKVFFFQNIELELKI